MSDATPRTYRHKPITVEVMHYARDGGNIDAVRRWLKAHGAVGIYDSHISRTIYIQMFWALTRAEPDDWIVRDCSGQFIAYKPDYFAANYEVTDER